MNPIIFALAMLAGTAKAQDALPFNWEQMFVCPATEIGEPCWPEPERPLALPATHRPMPQRRPIPARRAHGPQQGAPVAQRREVYLPPSARFDDADRRAEGDRIIEDRITGLEDQVAAVEAEAERDRANADIREGALKQKLGTLERRATTAEATVATQQKVIKQQDELIELGASEVERLQKIIDQQDGLIELGAQEVERLRAEGQIKQAIIQQQDLIIELRDGRVAVLRGGANS